MNRFMGIVRCKCPRCGQGEVFKTNAIITFKTPAMNKRCDRCNQVFERESGFFWGAMYVSYALTLVESAIIFLTCQLFFDDPFDYAIIAIIAAAMLLFSMMNFRYSRMIWLYIFVPAARQSAKETERVS